MKINRLIAATCSLAIFASFAVTSATMVSAAEGYKIDLSFAGYEVKGTTTFAKIDVNLTVPDTLSPYAMVPADWETTFEDTYSGFALQGLQVEIPKVDGLTYIASLSSTSEPIASIADGASALKLVYANTGEYASYYAGDLNKSLATIYYRITGDVDGTYELTVSDAVLKYASWSGTSSKYTPIEYVFSDFTIDSGIIKPEVSDIPVESVTLDNATLALDVYNNATAKLTATVAPDNATDPTVTWTTSNDGVATVATDGTVTAVAEGTATITATAGEKSATCEVTVTDSTPVTPTMPTKGTVIVDAVDGKVVIYADSKDASAIATNAKFEIEYTGTNEALKRADGTYKKEIKRTFSEILGGEIGEGKVTGKVHFGIKIPDTVPEADRAFFTINVK
jgi:hypothetical protein